MRNPFRKRYHVIAVDMQHADIVILGETFTQHGAERIKDKYPPIAPIDGKPMWSFRVEKVA
jgi:hypothetical protein